MAMKRKFVGRTIPKRALAAKAPQRKAGADAEDVNALLVPVEAIAPEYVLPREGEGATVVLAAGVGELAAASEGDAGGEEGATVVLSADEVFDLGPSGAAGDASDGQEAATQFLPNLSEPDRFGGPFESAAAGPGETAGAAASASSEEEATQFLPNLSELDRFGGPFESAAAGPEETADAPAAQLFVPKLPKSAGLHRAPLKPLSLPKKFPRGSASTASPASGTPTGRRQTLDEFAPFWLPPSEAPEQAAPSLDAQECREAGAERAAPLAASAVVPAATLDFGSPVPVPEKAGGEGGAAAAPPPEKREQLKPAKEDSGRGDLHALDVLGKSSTTERRKAALKGSASKSGSTKGGGKKGKSAFAFSPGDLVNHYELIRLLGKGGMGSVFMARDNKLGRRVAIKFLHTKDQELARRFILEARTTARCGHENIVIIYEADEFKGMPYMVLEYLQGTTLTKLLENNQPMPPGRVAELMVPVVRALVRAHAEGIVHRDLKPDNVMVTESGTIKVLDFGISKVLEGDDKGASEAADVKARSGKAEGSYDRTMDLAAESSDLTRSGAIVGTLAYMSPEQWRAKGIDHRTDIWAAGIMLFRMLSGKHPLDGRSGMELAITGDYKHQMPSLRDFAPTLPNDLIDLVDKCLKKRKEQRWSNAAELLEALEAFLPGRTRKLKIDESPYAGLSAFQEADADRFFGRSGEISAAVNRVRDQALIGIVGASGSGKSSIVRAGVLPALKRSGEAWESIVIRPGRSPLKALADAIAPLSSSLDTSLSEIDGMSKLTGRIRQEPGYAGSVLRARARRDRANILLFIDQFEELYTQVADLEERLAFTASLTSIADDPSSPTRVVLSIRSDFLDRVAEDQIFMGELSQGLIFLIAPNRNGLREAIVQPAEMAGFTFESESIVDEMLDHLAATPGALPLLQFAASKLWDSRDVQKKMLTAESYRALGGIAGALATHADSVLRELTPSMSKLARAVFLRLVTPERTRAIVSLDEISELSKDTEELKRLIDQLVRARLLVIQTSGGTATVEIVHESLVHTWPTLRRWLDETGEDAAFLEQLRNAAKQWQAKDFDKGLLWRGEIVEDAERFQRRYRGELPQVQADFLAATFKQKNTAVRRRRLAIIGSFTALGGLALVAFIGVITMAGLRKDAVEKANLAEEQKQIAVVAQQLAEQEKQRAESALIDVQKAREAAETSAEIAKKAQAEAEASAEIAQKRLVEVQEKEKERSAAEARALRAAKELARKNADLGKALRRAEEARIAARNAQKGAEKNAELARHQEQLARLAEERALKAAQEVASLLLQEQERVQRLQDQLGSPVIDELK